MTYGEKYTVGEFKLDLRENIGYLIQDAFPTKDKKKNYAAQDRDINNLADSLYINLIMKAQESIDIFKKENLFPNLDLRELAIDFSDPINLD